MFTQLIRKEFVGAALLAGLISAGAQHAHGDCPADLTGPAGEPDGVVDVFDLLQVISEWGLCNDPDDCPADLTGPDGEPDGVVDVFDLLMVISEWGVCPEPPLPPSVQVSQLNWIGDPECGTETIFASAVGKVVVTFALDDPEHHQLLSEFGGGYVNVVLHPEGGGLDWIVQNFHLAYPNEEYLDNANTAALFTLPGILHGQEVTWAEVGVSITAEPMIEPLIELDILVDVELIDYFKGGYDKGTSSGCRENPEQQGNHEGSDTPVEELSWISRPTGLLHRFDHVPTNWCGPESVSRSIDYLAQIHDNVTLPDGMDADDVMEDIGERLEEAGEDPDSGVGPDPLKEAKDEFNEEHDLPISTEKDYWGGDEMPEGKVDEIMEKLDENCDIEVFMRGDSWHVAMVESITKHEDGSYTITYADQRQCQENVPMRSWRITVQPDGTMTGDMGDGNVSGFFIECVDEENGDNGENGTR